ncbi:MAG: hypothetical protein HQ402_01720 [Parcubacteria group bacterium]|nr:hypothetical protein [Parcubacteria group bacterium]
MTKKHVCIILGCCVVILPFLGFPIAWKSFLNVVLGLAIIFTVFKVSNGKKRSNLNKSTRRRREVVANSFVEGGPVSSGIMSSPNISIKEESFSAPKEPIPIQEEINNDNADVSV